ncbi:hypothetical protein BDZ94DRAFT_1350362 [Collybia nuda]|uniref:DUF6532 domain-containing protein n=1 Tax=Collybia nuda TaxID=64659 RepID=A0A9P5XVH9_9AGAR|nr:hypothetical protein BDZ94DRAFT_1350362 [Collybia nuda]
MRKMITSRGSHAHGYLKDRVRPLVGPVYGLKTLADKPAVITKNPQIYSSLIKDSSFHYKVLNILSVFKDAQSLLGYCRHPIILDAICVIWFKNQSGAGPEPPSYFSPIRLVSLVLILTAAAFDKKDNKSQFEAHLEDLMEWAELKPDITDKILQKIYDCCQKGTGAVMPSNGCLNNKTQQRALLELEAQTGDTDIIITHNMVRLQLRPNAHTTAELLQLSETMENYVGVTTSSYRLVWAVASTACPSLKDREKEQLNY